MPHSARVATPRLAISALASSALLLSGCVTDPNTGHRKVSRTAIGIGVGVLGGLAIGGLIGGLGARILGASIGGIAGGSIGYEKDKQIRELREQTSGTGVAVTPADNNQAILLSTPAPINFDPGSAVLRPELRAALDSVAQNLIQHPNSLIDVYGYADSSENGGDPQALSAARAQTVADYLTTVGVLAGRIRSQGFGATLPIASNGTAEGQAQNRRVEIKIVPISAEQVQAARAAAGGAPPGQ